MRDIDNKDMIYKTAHELLALMADKTTHQEGQITSLDPDCYLDPDRFDVEKYGLFRKTPLMVGFSCELSKPGDFKLYEDAGLPVLLVRNREGKVKAFLNACRHRGAKLTEKPCGNQSRFTCPYHAWSFSTDGDLIALPAEELFGDVDKSKLGLVELPCEEKYGLIFAILTPGMPLDVDSFLGDGASHIAGWNFDHHSLVAERNLEAKANWKLALDTYTENYHFSVLHAADFGHKVKNCALHKRFGDKQQHWYLAWPSKSLEELRDLPESEWGDANSHFSFLYYIYPNTTFALYPETLSVHHMYPGDAVGDQLTRMKFYSRVPDPTPEIKEYIEGRLETFYRILQEEDYWVCGGTQEALSAGLLPEMLFGRNEPALAWTHEAIDRGVAEINHVKIPGRSPEKV